MMSPTTPHSSDSLMFSSYSLSMESMSPTRSFFRSRVSKNETIFEDLVKKACKVFWQQADKPPLETTGCLIRIRGLRMAQILTCFPDSERDKVNITIKYKKHVFKGRIKIGINSFEENYNLCILNIVDQRKTLSSLPFYEFNKEEILIRRGQEVYFVGFPLDQVQAFTHKGLISSVDPDTQSFSIDGTMMQGYPGGAIVAQIDGKLKLIGIINSHSIKTIEEMSNSLKQLREDKTLPASLFDFQKLEMLLSHSFPRIVTATCVVTFKESNSKDSVKRENNPSPLKRGRRRKDTSRDFAFKTIPEDPTALISEVSTAPLLVMPHIRRRFSDSGRSSVRESLTKNPSLPIHPLSPTHEEEDFSKNAKNLTSTASPIAETPPDWSAGKLHKEFAEFQQELRCVTISTGEIDQKLAKIESEIVHLLENPIHLNKRPMLELQIRIQHIYREIRSKEESQGLLERCRKVLIQLNELEKERLIEKAEYRSNIKELERLQKEMGELESLSQLLDEMADQTKAQLKEEEVYLDEILSPFSSADKEAAINLELNEIREQIAKLSESSIPLNKRSLSRLQIRVQNLSKAIASERELEPFIDTCKTIETQLTELDVRRKKEKAEYRSNIEELERLQKAREEHKQLSQCLEDASGPAQTQLEEEAAYLNEILNRNALEKREQWQKKESIEREAQAKTTMVRIVERAEELKRQMKLEAKQQATIGLEFGEDKEKSFLFSEEQEGATTRSLSPWHIQIFHPNSNRRVVPEHVRLEQVPIGLYRQSSDNELEKTEIKLTRAVRMKVKPVIEKSSNAETSSVSEISEESMDDSNRELEEANERAAQVLEVYKAIKRKKLEKVRGVVSQKETKDRLKEKEVPRQIFHPNSNRRAVSEHARSESGSENEEETNFIHSSASDMPLTSARFKQIKVSPMQFARQVPAGLIDSRPSRQSRERELEKLDKDVAFLFGDAGARARRRRKTTD